MSEDGSGLPPQGLGSVHSLTELFGFSLPAVFIASSRRSLSVPKPTKQNGGQFGDHSSIWDSWPIAFSGCPRGCDLKAVEVTVRRNRPRPDLVSHDEYSRSSGGKATTCLKTSDNVSRDRKIGIGTARQRCICQHQGGKGQELIAR